MKTFILILLLAITESSFNYAHSQEVRLTRKQRNDMDKMARELILKYGDIRYYELLDNNRRTITLKTFTDKEQPHYGKQYYEVCYGYDPEWRYYMEWDYLAKLWILKDSMIPYKVLFGNGYAYSIERLKKLEAQEKETPKMFFQLYDKEERDRRARELEEFNRRLREEAHIKAQRERDSLKKENK